MIKDYFGREIIAGDNVLTMPIWAKGWGSLTRIVKDKNGKLINWDVSVDNRWDIYDERIGVGDSIVINISLSLTFLQKVKVLLLRHIWISEKYRKKIYDVWKPLGDKIIDSPIKPGYDRRFNKMLTYEEQIHFYGGI